MSDQTRAVKSILYVGFGTLLLLLAVGGTIWFFENKNVWHMLFVLTILSDIFFWSIVYLGPKKFDIEARIIPEDVKRVIRNTLIVFTMLMGWFALTSV